MNAQIIVILCLCFAYTESSIFARRAILNRRITRPVTCNIIDISNKKLPLVQRRLPVNLTCNGEEVADMVFDNRVPEANVGSQCTFTYSCHYDSTSTRRETTFSCGETGSWEGTDPDCSNDDEIALAIVQTFSELASSEEETEEESEAEIESEETESENEMEMTNSTSEFNSTTPSLPSFGVRKNNLESEQTYARLMLSVCRPQEMCTELKSATECDKVYPLNLPKKMSKSYVKILQLMCRTCYGLFCSLSLTLL